jgi:DNA-binding NarL/FixJ family response regulator
MTRLRILIVDDHPIFRHGLRRVLSSQPDFRVVGEAGCGGEALQLAFKVRPDIILLDNSIPGSTTTAILADLNKAKCCALTVLMSEELDQDEIIDALQAGARAVLGKNANPEIVLKCIRSVVSGQLWVGQESVLRLVEILKNPLLAPKEYFGLTLRERQITEAIVEGLTNRDIAQQCSLSEQTVKNHLNRIFDKVGVSSRLELAMFAIHHGIPNRYHRSPPPAASRLTG